MGTDRFSIAGRTAIVTGASYGLGTTMAKGLADAGATVALVARTTDKLELVAKEIEAEGHQAIAIPCDVADSEQIKAMVAEAWDRLGRVDILVNNAGVSAEAGMMPERVTDELFAQTVQVNLNGTFTCCREVGARMMADGKGGSIINIASIAGLGGVHHFPPAYQASKAAVINLTRNLAASWATRGVRVNAVAPGWFPSEMTGPWFAVPDFLERFTKMAPMNRVGDPEELLGAIIFLASDAASFISGQTLAVDGGLSTVIGLFDYTDELFEMVETIMGEAGKRVTPETS